MEFTLHQLQPFSPLHCEEAIHNLLKTSVYFPIWQDPDWSRMLLKTGQAASVFACVSEKDGMPQAYCLLERRSIGASQYGYFCLGGPVGEKSHTEALIKKLPEIIPTDALFLQIEPLETLTYDKKWLSKAEKKFIEPHTALIDLGKTEEEILAAMKPKGRYNIRLAEKHGISTEWMPLSQGNIRQFYELLTETTERDRFAANSLTYFIALGEYLEKNNRGGLLFAKKEGELLAAGIFTFFGTSALYYYGASVSEPEKRKYMASYLVQWEAVREAKKRECHTYDFLGIAPENDKKHHLAGVTDFKLKLATRTHTWPDAMLHIIHPWKYRIFRLLKTIKNLGR